MIPQINEINFPQGVTLSSATVSLNDMGDKTITTQVKVDGAKRLSFLGTDGKPWAVEFRGERYIQPLLIPQASKGNDSLYQMIDLTFQHWAIYQMKRFFFCTLAPIESSTGVADKYIATITVDLPDFARAINQMLKFYFPDGSIYVYKEGDSYINPLFNDYDPQRKTIEISYSYIWDVLQKTYEIFDCHWEIVRDNDGKYAIKFGYPVDELSHVFQYGYEGGLMRVERQVQDDNIRNQILGRGGEKNLPYMYFKDYQKFHPGSTDSEYQNIGEPDPDAIPELELVYFDHLRDSNFRSYVQGWKVNPHRQASTEDGWSVVWSGRTFTESDGTVYSFNPERAEEDWAYAKGASDETFDPVEYVKDDESIQKYGLLQAGLEDNEDIFPTIQGMTRDLPCIKADHTEGHLVKTRIDELVDAEKVETDEIDTSDPLSKKVVETEYPSNTVFINTNISSQTRINTDEYGVGDFQVVIPDNGDIHLETEEMLVEEGYLGNILDEVQINIGFTPYLRVGTIWSAGLMKTPQPWGYYIGKGKYISQQDLYTVTYFKIEEVNTGVVYDEGYTNIPPGTYVAKMDIHLNGSTFVYECKRDTNGKVEMPVAVITDNPNMRPQVSCSFSINWARVKFNGFVVPNRDGIYHRSESVTVRPNETGVVTIFGDTFTIPEGGAMFIDAPVTGEPKEFCGLSSIPRFINTQTGQVVTSANLPAGEYEMRVEVSMLNLDSDETRTFTATLGNTYIYYAINDSSWKPTFDVWVKNLFGTDRTAFPAGDAGDTQYVSSVWDKLMAQDMTVTFVTGNLSSHSDWEFKVAQGGIYYDNSRSITVLDDEGVEHVVRSEWRLRLIKSDAEADTIHKYVPYKDFDAKAGDLFFFTNIYLPYEYVYAAELELNAVKTAELERTKEILPTWVVALDKIRVSKYDTNLIDSIKLGGKVWVKDSRFTEETGIQLFVKTINITWTESADYGLNIPDVEIVLSDEVETVSSTVQKIQSDIDTLSTQMRTITNLERAIRKVGDSVYLRKDGRDDVSYSPTQFARSMSSPDFRQGSVDGAGWSIRTDEEGKAVGEFDRVVVREDLHVNNLVVNQVSAIGGHEVMSAANMVVSNIEFVENESDEDLINYKCYFDQRNGTIGNLFQNDDIAMSIRYDEKNHVVLSYRFRIIEVGDNYILLDSAYKSGNGVPQIGDNIVQYGNYSDSSRQNVIVRSVIPNGYERMLTGLNSVNAIGTEYYYAGAIDGSPRWYVGNQINYAKYENGQVEIQAKVKILPGSEGADNILSWVATDTDGDVTTIAGGAVLSNIIGVASDGKMVAGINSTDEWSDNEHGKLAIFAGSDSQTEPDQSPFRVYEDGTAVANRLIANNADISGKIVSHSGEVGGFDIYDESLIAEGDNGNYTMTLQGEVISFNNTSRGISALLGDVYPSTSSTLGALKVEIDHSDSFNYGFSNVGMTIDVKGNNRSNQAIRVLNGVFSGLRPMTRAVSGTILLDEFDYTLITVGTTVINLPASPKEGQTYMIFVPERYSVTINGNGRNIKRILDAGSTTAASQGHGTFRGFDIFVYDKTNNIWLMVSNSGE